MVIPSTSRKDQVMELVRKKEQIEHSINDFGRILTVNKNVGMNESLVDESGFPRNDIDIIQVRHARNQIICLQNDLKALMKEIEVGIIDVHAEANVNTNASTKMSNMEISSMSSSSSSSIDIPSTSTNAPATAILVVTFVSPSSPAEECGIQKDDEILAFGSINADNFKELKQISDLVAHRQNQTIPIKIKRRDRTHDLHLTPKTWSGRGYLGCNIVIASSIDR